MLPSQERIHAAIGKGKLDSLTMPGTDGRGIKNSTGIIDRGLFYSVHKKNHPVSHRDYHVNASPPRTSSYWRNAFLFGEQV